MMRRLTGVALCATVLLSLPPAPAPAEVPAELLSQPWYPKAPPLPKPTGEVLRVKNAGELMRACQTVKAGGTILIADGHYILPREVRITKDNVTVRSESGDRTKVILDGKRPGARWPLGKICAVSYCSGVTFADFTIANCQHNGFKINSNHNVHRVTIYNCVIHNVWQRGVKGVRAPMKDGKTQHVLDCRVQYCLFYNDRPKKWEDESYEFSNRRYGGNYIGGMDIMGAKGWIVSDNVFVGIKGRTGGARGSIFMWNDSTDCVIERNIFIDCDRGVCMGNGHRAKDADGKPILPIHCTRFLVRNNFISGDAIEVGILCEFTQDCKVLNNTVHNPKNKSGRLIRIVQDNDGLLVANNIVSGRKIRIEKHTGTLAVRNNLEGGPFTDYFLDVAKGNLRLTDRAIKALDKAEAMKEVPADIDGTVRGEQPDLGADERRAGGD